MSSASVSRSGRRIGDGAGTQASPCGVREQVFQHLTLNGKSHEGIDHDPLSPEHWPSATCSEAAQAASTRSSPHSTAAATPGAVEVDTRPRLNVKDAFLRRIGFGLSVGCRIASFCGVGDADLVVGDNNASASSSDTSAPCLAVSVWPWPIVQRPSGS